MKWLAAVLFTLASGCTFLYVSGSSNEIGVDKAGTGVDMVKKADAKK